MRIPGALARKLHTRAVVGRTVVAVRGKASKRVRLRLAVGARRALAGASPFVLSARATRPFSRPATARVRITR
jgi:acyl dehydratase